MNAQKKVTSQEANEVGTPLPNGDYLVSAAALEKLGNGDLKAGRRWLRLLMADEREPVVNRGPSKKPASVRVANIHDEVAVLALLLEHLHMTVPKWCPIDPEMVLDNIQRGTRNQLGIVGVIEEGGVIVACTVLAATQPAYSRAYYIHEVFNVVHRDHRKSRHGEDLVDFGNWCSDEWTRQFGYPVHIISMIHTLSRVREKLRFYRRKMTQIGATFIYPHVET